MEISPSSSSSLLVSVFVFGDRRGESLIRCIEVSRKGDGDGVNFTPLDVDVGLEVDNHAPGGFGVCPGIEKFALGGVTTGRGGGEGVKAIPTCIS